MIEVIDEKGLFSVSEGQQRGLVNVFTGQTATPEQAQDLLNFRKFGNEDLEQYIKMQILKQPSSNAPNRKHKLLTMAGQTQESKKRFSQRENK